MNYLYPLRIFSDEELVLLNSENLKHYKKMKLLLFQLSDKTTVSVNGYFLDKNSVISIFNTLENNLDRYLLIYRIPELNNFFNSSKLDSIKFLKNVDFSVLPADNRMFILNRVIRKVNSQLGNDIIGGKISPKTVKNIIDFVKKECSTNWYDDFAKTYRVLEAYIIDLNDIFLDPIINYHRAKLELKSKVSILLNSSFYKCLKMLPPSMQTLQYSYALSCQKLLSNVLIRNFINPNNFNISTLNTIRIAIYIVLDNIKDVNHERNLQIINNFQSRTERIAEERLNNGIVFLFVLLIFVIVFFSIGKSQ